MAPASWACPVQHLPALLMLDRLGDYQVFTRAFDREVGGVARRPEPAAGIASRTRPAPEGAGGECRVAQRLIERSLVRPRTAGPLPRTTVNWIRPPGR